jgi:hypothetical protein
MDLFSYKDPLYAFAFVTTWDGTVNVAAGWIAEIFPFSIKFNVKVVGFYE